MNPVLVFTDTERITKEKALCSASVAFLQGLYDLITPLGITFTIEELVNVSAVRLNTWEVRFTVVGDLIRKKLLVKVAGTQFNGVPLSEEALDKLIAQPDVSHINAYIDQNYPYINTDSRLFMTDSYFELIEGVVGIKSTAFATIEGLYTYYTKNDKGAELATLMFSLCDKLNEYETYLGTNVNHVSYRAVKEVKGIEYLNFTHRPILQFIREKEELYPDYVVE